jgi:MtN3 and saliva related transmembrane protein
VIAEGDSSDFAPFVQWFATAFVNRKFPAWSDPHGPESMDVTQWVGWAAVAALFATMTGQAWKQWRDRVKHGVSKLFFVGQIAASSLFLTYSALVGDRVFVVGNALVLTAAIAGGAILLYNRARR